MIGESRPPQDAGEAVSPWIGTTPAGHAFPQVKPHSPRDPRSFHGKPEDWKRSKLKRGFGGALK